MHCQSRMHVSAPLLWGMRRTLVLYQMAPGFLDSGFEVIRVAPAAPGLGDQALIDGRPVRNHSFDEDAAPGTVLLWSTHHHG